MHGVHWPLFSSWKLVRIDVPGDGSCLFHALCWAIYKPYRDGTVDRYAFVSQLRQALAAHLPQHYDALANGNLESFASEACLDELTLTTMQATLNSHQHIGFGYMEYISDMLEHDIYVLSAAEKDVYTNNESTSLYKRRPSVILYYGNDHYQTIGVRHHSKVNTRFAPEHSLIKFLRKRLRHKTSAR